MKKSKPRPTSKGAKTSRPKRAAPRGMYLRVSIDDNNGLRKQLTLTSFRDVVSVGLDVARQVRQYIRGVPMLPHVTAYSLHVWPHWVQTAPQKPRKNAELDGPVDLDSNGEE